MGKKIDYRFRENSRLYIPFSKETGKPYNTGKSKPKTYASIEQFYRRFDADELDNIKLVEFRAYADVPL